MKTHDSPTSDTCDQCGAPFFARLEPFGCDSGGEWEGEVLDLCEDCRNEFISAMKNPANLFALTPENKTEEDAGFLPPTLIGRPSDSGNEAEGDAGFLPPNIVANKTAQQKKRVAKDRIKRKQNRRANR